MPQSLYLLHIISHPTLVSATTWTKWYTTEHIPDIVAAGASTRATFYRELGAENPPTFLALYQTNDPSPLTTPGYLDAVRTVSAILERESGSASCFENAEFDARNYRVVREGEGEKGLEGGRIAAAPSPFIVTVSLDNPASLSPSNASSPSLDVNLTTWYTSEHLPLVSKMPGYASSARYELGPSTPLTRGTPGRFFAVHGFRDLAGLDGLDDAVVAGWAGRKGDTGEGREGGMEVRRWELLYQLGGWAEGE